MGRKTWESIPLERKPLAKRINVVLSKSRLGSVGGESVFRRLDEAVDFVRKCDRVETCFVLGGAHVYSECLERGIVDEVIETEIQERFIVDTWMPPLPREFVLSHSEALSLDGIPIVRRTFHRLRK
jgi:dihydrofolate reductase/thymidylate synthase